MAPNPENQILPVNIRRVFGCHGLDLFGKMLANDPNKRIHPEEALLHQYFSSKPDEEINNWGSPQIPAAEQEDNLALANSAQAFQLSKDSSDNVHFLGERAR